LSLTLDVLREETTCSKLNRKEPAIV